LKRSSLAVDQRELRSVCPHIWRLIHLGGVDGEDGEWLSASQYGALRFLK